MGLFGGNKESYKDKKSLVIYFSRADENYAVGYIDKGNTEYIAEFVKFVEFSHSKLHDTWFLFYNPNMTDNLPTIFPSSRLPISLS